MDSFSRLVEIMARLRAPDGCPWDKKQTHQSLRPYLIEESAEVLQAIENQDMRNLCEELGDLILQPIFHAQIAADAGNFTLDDVLTGICEKLVRRHPHVFGDASAQNAEEVISNWEAIKRQEKAKRGEEITSVLGEIPTELSALSSALKISKRAAKVGFEWEKEADVLAKLREETLEIEEALQHETKERVSEEIGDLLFTAVNLARWRGINPEMALRDVNRKFIARFEKMEAEAKTRELELESLTPKEWDELWNRAKSI
ncbi:tetrapyrrole methylase family protein / MazG family protein [Abditibacterium utsteinense]|uniref:Tetrapyrrole methylase family protein / MazG family protein n=1 Tax=Abditibacterium utsteinense TaxID=1960156 RepID=A0A2S8SUA8_9BACT|nr:nucleoside triphosphate pyrophosphohydrolase [Abditibacterium utsteinense]PQV64384.1 tetrapyrrole methylase family protein / MazG family protein [Abditibacterium utsteinense]